MSLFKFGQLEAEVDFTDADFLEAIEEAKKELAKDVAEVPKVGREADIIRAQCQCYFSFFDNILGSGAHEALFEGRTSFKLCIEAAEALLKVQNASVQEFDAIYGKYNVQQHGNRQQKRYYKKQQGKNKKQNYSR